MGKFHRGGKSSWDKAPFTIGREGPEFLPDPFGEKRASGPKTVKGGGKKTVPKKIK